MEYARKPNHGFSSIGGHTLPNTVELVVAGSIKFGFALFLLISSISFRKFQIKGFDIYF